MGAQDYNGCDPKKDDCAALADKMGVKAVDDKTLEVTLTTPQPWFVQQVAHHSFLAVNKKAVDQFGDKWTEAANIVTNGPFKLERGSTTPASTSSSGTSGVTPTASS